MIHIDRPTYDQESFDKQFGARHIRLSAGNRIQHYFSKWLLHPKRRLKKSLLTFLPFITWLKEYDLRSYLLSDFLSGLTVGIMNIPQGMAYGILTLLPAQYGLYTSFFPPLIYAFFGTSKHISFGTFAVISVMVRSVIEKNVAVTNPYIVENVTYTNSYTTMISNTEPVDYGFWYYCHSAKSDDARDLQQMLSVAFCLTFLVGICQILFGLLQAGFLAVYLSDQLVEGLTAGAAVQVLTSQMGKLFGITGLPSLAGVFGLFKFYTCFLYNITLTNIVTLGMGVFSILLLIVTKEWMEPLFKQKFNLPIPMELFIVVFSTLLSKWALLKEEHNVVTVGDIPTGIPLPSMPDFSMLFTLLPDAITISVVIFSISVSMCKLFGKKHHYTINANQEWFAYGAVHLISSFFSCHCAGSSLSRSALQEAQGGKSQLAAIFSSLVILLVLLALAPLFFTLPHCALAAIIIVNLKSMLWQTGKLPRLWRESKIDFLIWIVTFSAVVTFDVSFGLIIGVVFAMMTVIFRTQWPDSVCLGNIPDTEIYKGVNAYSSAVELKGIQIYRFDSPLYFANALLFKEQLYAKVKINPVNRRRLSRTISSCANNCITNSISQTSLTVNNEPINGFSALDDKLNEIQAIIIDCSSFPYIDLMGCEVLQQVHEEFSNIDVVVLFCCVKIAVRQSMQDCHFYDSVPKSNIFITVHDAVMALLSGEFKSKIKHGNFGSKIPMEKEDGE